MVAVASCSKSDEGVDTAGSAKSAREVSVVVLADGSRVAVQDDYSVTWDADDSLLAWSTDGTISEFAVEEYDASSSTFTGDVYTDTFRLLSPYSADTQIVSGECEIDITNQVVGAKHTYMVTEDLISDGSEASSMLHIGAIAVLDILFTSDFDGYTLNSIAVTGLNSGAVVDLSENLFGGSFYSSTSSNTITVDCEGMAITPAVPMQLRINIMPTTIAAGASVDVTITMTDGDGATIAATSTVVNDGSDLEFSRATYNPVYYDLSISDINPIETANAEIEAASGEESVTVTITDELTGSDNTIVLPDSASSSLEDVTVDFSALSSTASITIDGSLYSGTVNIIVSSLEAAEAITIDAENAHVTFSGTAGEVYVASSTTTFVVEEGAKITKLTVNAGNVGIYGDVDELVVAEDNTYNGRVSLYVSDCATDLTDIGNYIVEDYMVSGAGTEASPYLIYSAAQLRAIRTIINKGYNSIRYSHYRLESDIDLDCNENKQWAYIGSQSSTAYSFQGVFDGNGHTISGLYINNTTRYQGLFGYLKNAVIKNLIVEGSITNTQSTSYSSHLGAICVENTTSTIINCIANVALSALDTTVGGIVPSNSGTVVNCFNKGSLKGESYVGGIAGFNTGGDILYCYNTGSISGSSWCGGICGFQNSASSDMSYCYYSSSSYSKAYGYIQYGTYTSLEKETAANMQTQDFVNIMNSYAATYNSGSPAEKACGWKVVEGDYPTLDLTNYPEL